MVLIYIIRFDHQILLSCVWNNFRSQKFHKFGDFFQPARLFHPARLLDTLEYLFLKLDQNWTIFAYMNITIEFMAKKTTPFSLKPKKHHNGWKFEVTEWIPKFCSQRYHSSKSGDFIFDLVHTERVSNHLSRCAKADNCFGVNRETPNRFL